LKKVYLTPGEKRVLKWAALGFASREIAEKQRVSRATIRTQLEKVRAKCAENPGDTGNGRGAQLDYTFWAIDLRLITFADLREMHGRIEEGPSPAEEFDPVDPARDQRIATMYREGESLETIGQRFNLTRTRVARALARAG
jgi:hypothetical protein